MVHYVDASVQTLIEGLTRDPAVHPPALSPPTDTTTPPDDMAIDKLQLSSPVLTKTTMSNHTSPTLLLKRKKQHPMVTRISMPAPRFDGESPASPPPTEALLSPLPAANKLHAGHTPIIPRALSPLPPDESDPPTPVQDEPLSGPLFLPPQPGDGAEDTMSLTVLDAELEKLRLEQEKEEQEEAPVSHTDAPMLDTSPSQSAENHNNETQAQDEDTVQRDRHNSSSAEARRPSGDELEAFDGVLLKKPKMNMGAPLGQA